MVYIFDLITVVWIRNSNRGHKSLIHVMLSWAGNVYGLFVHRWNTAARRARRAGAGWKGLIGSLIWLPWFSSM